MNPNVLNLLGLAMRSRNVILGEKEIMKAMQNSTGKIVFLASDAGSNIVKKIHNKATTYHHIIIDDFDSNKISKAIGKTHRKAAIVLDKGFNDAIKKYLNS